MEPMKLIPMADMWLKNAIKFARILMFMIITGKIVQV